MVWCGGWFVSAETLWCFIMEKEIVFVLPELLPLIKTCSFFSKSHFLSCLVILSCFTIKEYRVSVLGTALLSPIHFTKMLGEIASLASMHTRQFDANVFHDIEERNCVPLVILQNPSLGYM